MGAYPEYVKLISFSTSSSASGLSSMRRRRDLRRAAKGYLEAITDGGVAAGRGLGNRTARGGEARESSRGKRSYPYALCPESAPYEHK